MIRARFRVPSEDYRPVVWPITHPYWCTGEGEDYFVLVAYVDSERQLLEWWPDAQNIDASDNERTEYTFTDRFAKPEWFV